MTKEQTIEIMKTLAETAGIKFTIEEEEREEKFKDGDTYYFITNAVNISEQRVWGASPWFDTKRLEIGNVFRTKEEVTEALDKLKFNAKLKAFADEANKGWEPDWDNMREEKWYIAFVSFGREQKWIADFVINHKTLNTVYFKTKELTERAIKEIVIPILGETNEKG